ncbi:hypothetical protein ACFO3K_14625 [Cellulomonas algicola]
MRADPRAGARPDAAVVTDGTPGARAPVPALRARQVLALQRLAGNAAATAAVAGAPARTGPDTAVIDRELAEATSAPGVSARTNDDGRHLLVPDAPPVPAPPLPDAVAKPPGGAGAATGTPSAGPTAAGGPGAAAPGGAGAATQAGGTSAQAGGPPAGAATAAGAVAQAGAAGRAGPASAARGGREPGEARGGAPDAAGPVAGAPGVASTLDAAVAPPAPDALAAQLPAEPTAEAVAQDEADQRAPEEKAAEAAALTAGVRATADERRTRVAADATDHRTQVGAGAAARRADLATRLAAALADVTARTTAARARLTTQAAQARAAVREGVAADVAAVRQATAGSVAEARQGFTTRRTALTQAVEAEVARAQAAVDAEAARGVAAMESAAVDCEQAGEREASRYRDPDDPGPEQREAARRVGRESAADIRAKKAGLRPELASKAAEHVERVRTYVATVTGQLSEAETSLVTELERSGREAEERAQEGLTGGLAAVDRRLEADVAAVTAAGDATRRELTGVGARLTRTLDADAAAADDELAASGRALDQEIDHGATETTTVLAQQAAPFLPGVREQVAAATTQGDAVETAGRSGMAAAAGSAGGRFDATVQAFAAAAGAAAQAVDARFAQVADGFTAATDATLAARQEESARSLEELRGRQRRLVDGLLAEADRTCADARAELTRMGGENQRATREATDRAVEEAVKPKTDDVNTRAHEAAEQVDEGFWAGLGRAVWKLAVGLVVLVVVALVVAAIAAAFGVILTAWTAVMIAGALLLTASLVLALVHRLGQRELQGRPVTAVLVALADTVGVTGIYEGIGGHDIVTGAEINVADRTERGILGAVTLVGLIFGARSAIKGPPGGTFTQPVGSVPGFGAMGAGARAVAGARSVAGELAGLVGRGAKAVKEWWNRPRTPEPEPVPPTQPAEPVRFGRTEDGYHADRIFMDWLSHEIPPEGWKLHVSATPESAAATAEAVLPVLRRMGVNHKVVGSPEQLASMGGGQQGKFITIYPDTPAQARAIVSTLDSVLAGRGSGPAVAGEAPVGGSGVVYSRYGGFTKGTVTDPATGLEVADQRGQICPPWIENIWATPARSVPVPVRPVPAEDRDEEQ